ncbi:carbonic anhydrase [Mycobacterium sp. CBMA271]|uniref:SulP family inorganic anion transporter n=1 Tax=unclassified Mycobacteroides TaxID=2618759 RepID=UPI0012DD7CB0|nr:MULTISPECIES: bifunctional SulP family inorganic anion transporter/carbonic anhydrase [unclassified Mycobacteroides]MUM17207.1 carbonic anhydrase [Mycobacteroides sp. CBMA 326]MUM23963.1 carbonic anhydrase [Mycobacteroides sp. CBMA 271]
MTTSATEQASKVSFLQNMRHDLPASLVVFLVALPLSLGIAIASGAPLMAGLIAAVVGGIVAGAIGGSPLQVSGPAAGLTVVVAELINEFGWQLTCLITVGAGVLQILFGLSRMARAALAIAPVVVHAMLAGIGVTIALQQVHVLMGGTSQSSAWQNIKALPQGVINHHLPDVIIGLMVIAILLLWPKLPPKIRMIPGALVAIVAATALAYFTNSPAERITLSGNFFDALSLPTLVGPANGEWGSVILGVVTIALIASVESLLSAVAVDKLHTGPRTNFDREMIGQGSANVASGFLGGLPITGVIVRSSTNVAAGAKTRASAILHGLWVLLFASLFSNLVQLIPKAALAGLLIIIGVQLVKLAHMKLAWRTGDLAVYTVTIVSVVFLNLLEGVGIGLLVAIGILVARVMRAHMDARPFGTEGSRQWHVELDGTLSFLSMPRLTKILSTVPPGAHVTLAINADYVDHAISEAISDWKRAHEAGGGTVMIVESSHAKLHHAHETRPKRHFASRAVGLVPWRSWRRSENDGAGASIIDGINEYNARGSNALRPHVAELIDSQNPDALFLTCADSRILPNVITASGPGDLFTVRNVGNLVPTDPADGSVDASLDFAINQLGISSVVVCGHSSCGAMKALLTESTDAPTTPVGRWLDYGRDSLIAFEEHHPARASAEACGFNEVDQLGIVNVAIQVERLIHHPTLAGAVVAGRLRVVGTFFNIAEAHVYEVDENGIVGQDGSADGVVQDPAPATS